MLYQLTETVCRSYFNNYLLSRIYNPDCFFKAFYVQFEFIFYKFGQVSRFCPRF